MHMIKKLKGLFSINVNVFDKNMTRIVLFIGMIHIYLRVTSKTTKENPSQSHLQSKNQITNVKTGWSCLVLMNSAKVINSTARLWAFLTFGTCVYAHPH